VKLLVMSPQMLRDNHQTMMDAGFGGKRSAYFADEAHELAIGSTEQGSEMAKNARKFAENCSHVALGTGTAIENDSSELHSLIDMVAPGALGDKRKFASEWQRLAQQVGGGGKLFAREKMTAMRARLAPFMLSYHQAPTRKGADGGDEPVGLTHRVQEVDLTVEQKHKIAAINKAYEKDRTSDDPDKKKSAALTRDSKINRVLLQGGVIDHVVADLDKHFARNKDADGNVKEKALVWSQEIGPNSPMNAFRKRLTSDKRAHLWGRVTGEDDDKAVQESMRRVNGDGVRKPINDTEGLMISNSANYGLNAQGATHVAMLGFPFVPSKQQQLIARALRNGQTRNVTAVNYISKHLVHKLQQFRTQKQKKGELDLLTLLQDEKSDFAGALGANMEDVRRAARGK
jgi:hypothetical protein